MPELPAFLHQLLAKGGPVVGAVLVVSVWMWWLLVERYWFLQRRFPRLCATLAAQWLSLRPQRPDARRRLREAWLAGLGARLDAGFGTIRALTAILPLLGLLGTVTGMITTFDFMTQAGNGSPRELSRGIDAALISTIAGLVTALSGLYAGNLLETRARHERERLASLFT